MLVHGELETISRVSKCFSLYKWRLHCYEVHTLEIMSFLVCNLNLRKMKRQGLIVFAGDPPKGYDSVMLDLYLWELCFPLVSPLWELCYSLASC